ncbi:hypothetical protein ACFX15_009069 [Malus domestica]
MWLPSLPLGHPELLGEVSVTPNLRVSSLIAPSSREWDVGFLQPIISMVDHEAILATPIGDPWRKYHLVWAANKNGRYLVKSGYRWLQLRSLAVQDHRLPGARSVLREVWKGIWHLEAVLFSNMGSDHDRTWVQSYIAFTC